VTSTIYLDTVKKVARASITGTAQPSVHAKLLAHLKLIIKFFGADGVIAVDADTPTCVIKPKLAPTGAPSLIDTTAVRTGTGATSQYVFEWASADSTTLRALMDATGDPTQPVELRCEVEYELNGNLERIAFPIFFETSYTRPEDPAPEANTDSSWEWLKLRAPVANGFSHDDVERELTVAGGAGSGDVVGPASSVDSRPALFNGTTGKLLKQGSAALGDAAYKNTGTTAGTLAAGDDARMTNARTPTAHASTHLTGGADAIQAATASQPGLATAAQITKLDGIEALADVTDAGNVGTAISGADAITILADADKLPITASGVLKTLAYSALKTLLNALYAIKGAITGSGLTMSTARLLGRSTASSGAIEEITVGSGLTLTAGTLSATGGGGSGDVVGPASASDNAIVRFDGAGGKMVQTSGITIADGATGTLSGTNTGDQSATSLGLVIGTNVQAYDADLTSIASLSHAFGALTNNGSGTFSYTEFSTGGQTGDGGKIVKFGTSGELKASLLDVFTPSLPTQFVRLSENGIYWNNFINSGFSVTFYPAGGTLTEHRSIYLPDATGTVITSGNLSAITGVGTLASGVWQGSIIAPAYLGTGSSITAKFLRGDGTWQTISGGGDALVANSLDQFADVAQTAGQTLAITSSTTLAGGTHSGTNTGDQTNITGNAATVTTNANLTGPVTSLGNATSIANGAISNAMLANGAVANLSGTNTGDNAVNSNYSGLVSNATHTGDATGATVLTLATVNANAGSFGSSTTAVALTINAKGLVTAASAATITPAVGSITGLGTGVATALAVNLGTPGASVINGQVLGTPSSGTLTNCTGLPVAGITASTSTALGVGSLDIGHASDTTLARSSAGNLTIEGNLIYRAGGSFVGMPFEYSTAVSDEATALTAGTAKLTFRMPCAMTVTSVRASVGTAPTGSTLIVDINENGTSILSTKLSIDATEKTSTTAAVPAVISDSALADDSEITIDIDQIGSTIAGAGLKVTIIGTRA